MATKKEAKKELWQSQAEMIGGDSLVTILNELREGQRALAEKLLVIEQQHDEMRPALMNIIGAFPSADFENHRRYHQSVIEWRELRNKMVKDILIKSAASGIFAGVCWLLYAVWQTIKVSIKQ